MGSASAACAQGIKRMTPDEQQIETKIASLGLTAPRITPQRIDSLV